MDGRILLVDDETAIAAVLSRTLTAHGWAVRVVSNGQDAVDAFATSPPDVILLDVNLPDITGWEVLRRLSKAGRLAIPVIVFSASPLSPSRVDEFQPAGVLTKPFPVQTLLRLVSEVTETSRKEVRTDA